MSSSLKALMERNTASSVRDIMVDFARLTGLSPASSSPRRYLWTDAFAVCNFLGLYEQTGEDHYLNVSLALVEQTHEALGRHRGDDGRTGRLSGLDGEQARLHPTMGGLRIGKKLRERKEGEAFDDPLEWDRDGQYYHYLTKWMHALNRVTQVTGDFRFNRWAIELAKKAHASFVYSPSHGRGKRMYWKMSVDLSRPLVSSMGQHDPLDGLVTYCELQVTAAGDAEASSDELLNEIEDISNICSGMRWETDDALGIGGLLTDAHRIAQLIAKQKTDVSQFFNSSTSMAALLHAAALGLASFIRRNPLQFPADLRLAFRELGLSIGLQAFQRMRSSVDRDGIDVSTEGGLREILAALTPYTGLADAINRFWLRPDSQKVESWRDHIDINLAMLATSLAPDGYLTIDC